MVMINDYAVIFLMVNDIFYGKILVSIVKCIFCRKTNLLSNIYSPILGGKPSWDNQINKYLPILI